MLSLCANASSQPWPPLFNGFINDVVLQLSGSAQTQVRRCFRSYHRCPESLSDRRVLVSATRSYNQLDWGLHGEFAGQTIGPMKSWVSCRSSSMLSHARCSACRCVVLMEYEDAPWHTPNIWQHLLLLSILRVVRWVCGAFSWLSTRSCTVLMFSGVRTERCHLLPGLPH